MREDTKAIPSLFLHRPSAVFSLGSWHLGPVAGLQANIIKTNSKRYSFGSERVGKVFCLAASVALVTFSLLGVLCLPSCCSTLD